MSDTHMEDYAWTDCPHCGCGSEHEVPHYGHTPDPIVMHCDCSYVSHHSLTRALTRWVEVEEQNYRDHMWHSDL
jgi:hypothetical protein